MTDTCKKRFAEFETKQNGQRPKHQVAQITDQQNASGPSIPPGLPPAYGKAHHDLSEIYKDRFAEQEKFWKKREDETQQSTERQNTGGTSISLPPSIQISRDRDPSEELWPDEEVSDEPLPEYDAKARPPVYKRG